MMQHPQAQDPEVPDDDDAVGALLDERDPCPACGAYYTLSVTAPPVPGHLAEHGTDEEIAEWEAEHPHNISECTACGWRSDEEG